MNFKSFFFLIGLLTFSLYLRDVFAQPQINIDENDPYQARQNLKSAPISESQNVFIMGYGDIHYNNVDNANDTLELHRFVFGLGYDFNDRIRFRSEVEFEHGFTEMYIEYAYVDFDLTDWATLRVGALLLPIGTLNQLHEPPFYYSVERPEIYSRIIPTTWMETGFGFHGQIAEGLTYQIYGHSSLNFNDGFQTSSGFSGSSGLRGGRAKLANTEMNNFAGSARLQYTGVKGLRLGTSGFFGFTSQGDARVNRGEVALLEADAKYTFEGIEIEGLVAVVFNPDAGSMTTAQRADGNIGATDVIGKRMFGYMIEGAYHVFHHVWPEAPVDLVAFARWEAFDTHHAVPGGFAKNPAFDRQTATFGVSFMPIPQVALKADYQWKDNGANTANNQFNLGLGYYF